MMQDRDSSHRSVDESTVRKDRRRPYFLTRAGVVFACLPITYLFALGPMAWMHSRLPSGPVHDSLEVLATPARFVYDRSPKPIRWVLEGWTSIWE